MRPYDVGDGLAQGQVPDGPPGVSAGCTRQPVAPSAEIALLSSLRHTRAAKAILRLLVYREMDLPGSAAIMVEA
jgi:hypothetical protein